MLLKLVFAALDAEVEEETPVDGMGSAWKLVTAVCRADDYF